MLIRPWFRQPLFLRAEPVSFGGSSCFFASGLPDHHHGGRADIPFVRFRGPVGLYGFGSMTGVGFFSPLSVHGIRGVARAHDR